MKLKAVELLEFYSPEDDNTDIAHQSDTNRPKLTLRHLNSLRKMRDAKDVDEAEHLELVQNVYASPDDLQEF